MGTVYDNIGCVGSFGKEGWINLGLGKVTVYNCREFDEKELFLKYGEAFGLELTLCPENDQFTAKSRQTTRHRLSNPSNANYAHCPILRGFPNVTVTHHMAFYTDDCVETVVRDSLAGCKLFLEGKENPWRVV